MPKKDSDEDDSRENSREKGNPKPINVKSDTRYVFVLIRIIVDRVFEIGHGLIGTSTNNNCCTFAV